MKKTIITCDTCKKTIGKEHIRIGSESGTELCFENNLPTKPGETQCIGRYQDLHFCSKEHFYKYFFGKEPQ